MENNYEKLIVRFPTITHKKEYEFAEPMVTLFIEREKRAEKLAYDGSISGLLNKFKINPSTVIVVKNNAVVTEDANVKGDDDVKVLSVISGG